MMDSVGGRKKALAWPDANLAEVPFAIYVDPEIYELEQKCIFSGPVWHYLALDAEIPDPGDFVSTYVGSNPVVVNRAKDGRVYAFVNRCAHRGATVTREVRGNCKVHTCIYHQWSFDLEGNLVGVPYRNGLNGQGGFPEDFSPEDHGLRKLRIAIYRGIIFGTLSNQTPPIEEYLGQVVRERLDQLFSRPIRVLGYQRQNIKSNWKLMVENVKDSYHAALLHAFNSKFGFSRSTQNGQVSISPNGLHSILTAYRTELADVDAAYRDVSTYKPKLELEDKSLVKVLKEYDDDIATSIISVFPSFLYLSTANLICFRQVRPKKFNEFDMVWTYLGYVDDTEEMTAHRLHQSANLFGPAGFISVEDAEALEMVQRALEGEGGDAYGLAALGGRDAEPQGHLVTEVAIRGFWKGYKRLMGL